MQKFTLDSVEETVEKNKRSCPLLCARWLLACTMCSKKWKKIVLQQVLRSFEWILSAEEVLGTKITYPSSILKLHYFLNFNALCSCCMALVISSSWSGIVAISIRSETQQRDWLRVLMKHYGKTICIPQLQFWVKGTKLSEQYYVKLGNLQQFVKTGGTKCARVLRLQMQQDEY